MRSRRDGAADEDVTYGIITTGAVKEAGMFETPDKLMTLDEFLAFIDAYASDEIGYELHQGVLVQASHSKATRPLRPTV